MAAWKDDFPISWADDHYVTRREFTKSLAMVSCAAFGATGTLAALGSRRGGSEETPVRVARVDELPVGGWKIFAYPGPRDPCLLVRLEGDRFVAFSQKCTHLGCPVVYRAEARTLYCACHEGFFAAEDGRVLAGPPPRPLPRVDLERRGGELWAIGIRS